MRLIAILVGLALSAFAVPIAAGEFNQVLDIGDVAPTWEALEAVDGRRYGSDDMAGAALTVVVFTCNGCPYAIDYEERLLRLQQRLGDGQQVRVVAINSNAIPDDSLELMRARADERKFDFVYLKDPDAKLAEAFGAVRTPEWFVLDAERRVIYMGAFDDAADEQKVQTKYLENAVEQALAGKPVEVAETAPVGCLIRRARRR